MRRLLLSLALIPSLLQNADVSICFKPFPLPAIKIDPKEVKCLAVMIFGEARGEAEIGQVAVAYTAVNRAVKTSLCKVVLAPMQYSVFNNNPAMRLAAQSLHVAPHSKSAVDVAAWEKAVKVANMVARKHVDDPTDGSTYYLAPKAMKALGYSMPLWSRKFKQMAVIDNHVFYKPPEPKI